MQLGQARRVAADHHVRLGALEAEVDLLAVGLAAPIPWSRRTRACRGRAARARASSPSLGSLRASDSSCATRRDMRSTPMYRCASERLRLGGILLAQRHLDVRLQSRHRRAQLVRGVGDEAVLEAQHFVQPRHQLVHRLHQRLRPRPARRARRPGSGRGASAPPPPAAACAAARRPRATPIHTSTPAITISSKLRQRSHRRTISRASACALDQGLGHLHDHATSPRRRAVRELARRGPARRRPGVEEATAPARRAWPRGADRGIAGEHAPAAASRTA